MEFDTLARHGVDVVGVMGNNGIWALEKHPMEFLYGYSVAAELRPETRYDQVVEALGGHGELVRDAGRAAAGARAGASRPASRRSSTCSPIRPSRTRAVIEPGLAAGRLRRLTSTTWCQQATKEEAARSEVGRLPKWPRQDGQGYVP